MWTLRIHIPGNTAFEYSPKPGINLIGRDSSNAIELNIHSVSRQHARLDYDQFKNTLQLHDLNSTNGTFLNNELLTSPTFLKHDDIIRVGNVTLKVIQHATEEKGASQLAEGSHPITRELLLVSLDTHAVLLAEVAERLNTILDLEEALTEVSSLIQKNLRADRCMIILKEQFNTLPELGFPTTLARATIKNKTANIKYENKKISSDSSLLLQVQSALCVPVMANKTVIALIYMYKTDPTAQPFTKTDLEITTAISHQAALTIQRVNLIKLFQEEQSLRQMFQRFISPHEIDFFMDEYKKRGSPPGLTKKGVSIMFVDIADSTSLANNLSPQNFGDLLSKYYLIGTKIIFQNRGVVRYIGDGILAVFGMTRESANHASDAVRAGLGILKKIKILQENYEDDIFLGIGINSGEAMVGYVGSQQRLEFTALGEVVNAAHSLQSHARPNRLLVGNETFETVKEEFQSKKLHPIKVKGRAKPIEIYEITG